MPRGRTENLKPQAHVLTDADRAKGREVAARNRKAKKTMQAILNDYLDGSCKGSPQFSQLAEQMGLEDSESIKQILAVACLLNTVKTGGIKDLAMLSNLLGETDTAAAELPVVIDGADELED